MAWCRTNDESLSGPMLIPFTDAHIRHQVLILLRHAFAAIYKSMKLNLIPWIKICQFEIKFRKDLAFIMHYSNVMMSAMASQITSGSIVYSTVCSDTDQRKYWTCASLAFVMGIHQWSENSPHKRPVTRKIFPFDDVIMVTGDKAALFKWMESKQNEKPLTETLMTCTQDVVGISNEKGLPWWRHQMETFSALLVLCVGNSPAAGEFPSQRLLTRSFGVFFDLCLNKRLSKQ